MARTESVTLPAEKPAMVVAIDNSGHRFYALEWTIDHFFALHAPNFPFNLIVVHAKPSPTTNVGYAGPDELLKSTMSDKISGDVEGMEALMEQLLALIDDAYKYVDDVVENRVAPDNSVGRFIVDAVSSLPKMPPAAFDKLVNDSLQDQLLMVDLSSITRTQLSSEPITDSYSPSSVDEHLEAIIVRYSCSI